MSIQTKLTIREVAKEAGVSIATISRYLNKADYVSEQTEKKIKEVMDRLNYKPNEIARSLANRASNTIALIIPDITNPFFPELVTVIEEVTRAKGYSIILVNASEKDLENKNFWKDFQNRYIDGFILASFQFEYQILSNIKELDIPFVRIDRAANHASDDSIGIDNYSGAKLAIEHLIEVGCKNIAHVSGPPHFLPSVERKKAYMDIVEKTDINQNIPLLREGNFSLESGFVQTKELIEQSPEIDGIFYANDLMAIGGAKALKKLDVSVPNQIAIIGFDGIALTEMVEPEISSIQQPIREIGIAAINKLVSIIENKSPSVEKVELNLTLIKRESTLGKLNSNSM